MRAIVLLIAFAFSAGFLRAADEADITPEEYQAKVHTAVVLLSGKEEIGVEDYITIVRIANTQAFISAELKGEEKQFESLFQRDRIKRAIEVLELTQPTKGMGLYSKKYQIQFGGDMLLYQTPRNFYRIKRANQALVPTPASVTPAAGAPVAPDAGAAHL
jgi:hypothetical protein